MRIRFFSRHAACVLRGLSVVVLFWSGPSLAQNPPTGQPGAPPEAMEPPSENPAPPADPSDENVDPNQPLSDQLKQGDGVLEPPRTVDPGIKQPVPDDFKSKTPVITPQEHEEQELEEKEGNEPEAPAPK